MSVRRPTMDQVEELAGELGMTLSESELESYHNLLAEQCAAWDYVDEAADYLPEVKYPRTPGYRPEGEENEYNAWYVKTTVAGASAGKLKGKRVVLKDNVCLAGVPMMNGASTLEGYVPEVDATIATRMLDAGATIVGKAHCEYFCFSGGSHTNATGPVRNPHNLDHSAGGSSSGSAVLVSVGEVAMAIGGDQGGSIRMPSSYCGTYGMKPTHGLVPYTGVMPIEQTVDHVGPITASVADNALLLEVLAGPDGLDPRQSGITHDANYTDVLDKGVKGLRIGVVEQGFAWPACEADVNEKVRAAAELFKKLGATVEDISVPAHAYAQAVWTPIIMEGAVSAMLLGNGFGNNWKGLFITSLLDKHAGWRSRANEFPHTVKLSALAGYYFLRHYNGRYYAKAQNLNRKLVRSYDEALDKYDVLLMPTTPMKATPLPPADASPELYTQRAFEMLPNTAPFDATGHPAMSIPCGMSDGLPVGMMLVGKHYHEATIYQAASAFASAEDWKGL
ncbi:MAG TPA: amidase [Gammaproteobacteria bacterium]|nr:amidase [Gammaproteobacteria bacterium]HYW91561.1 amidase [Gammaproteobacteria bacterium]